MHTVRNIAKSLIDRLTSSGLKGDLTTKQIKRALKDAKRSFKKANKSSSQQSMSRFSGGPEEFVSLADYIGGPEDFYAGAPAQTIQTVMGRINNVKQIDVDLPSSGLILNPRSVTKIRALDFVDTFASARSLCPTADRYDASATVVGGQATLIVTKDLLTRRNIYPFAYLSIVVPFNVKGGYIVSLKLNAFDASGRLGSTDPMQLKMEPDSELLCMLINFTGASNSTSPMSIQVDDNMPFEVSVKGLPDDAVVTLVMPGPPDAIRNTFERVVTKIAKLEGSQNNSNLSNRPSNLPIKK